MPPAPRSTTLALALLAIALVVAELYLGEPLWGRHWHAYLLALAAALLLAIREVWSGARRPPVVAGLLAFALFVSNDRALGSGDTNPANALPFMILRHGTLSLDPLPDESPRPYWVAVRDGRRWSEYPVAASVLALPVFLPAALGRTTDVFTPVPGKLAAALFAALSVALLLATLLRLGTPLSPSVLLAAIFAAASPMLSVASQALWQHGPGILGLTGMLWAIVRSREPGSFAWAAGAFAGLACAARPTNVLVVAAVGLVVLLEDRGRAIKFAAAAAIPLALVAAYNAYAFGAPWRTGYDFTDAPHFTSQLHLAELLFSPTRGLVLFVPWAPLAVVGWALGARRERLHVALAIGSAATLVAYSAWSVWWGGWSYGPRLLADLTPLLALGCAPLALRRSSLAALLVTGALALGLHGLYAFASRSPVARSVVEIDRAEQAMEWRRYPLAAPFLR